MQDDELATTPVTPTDDANTSEDEVSEMDSLDEQGTKYAAGIYEDNEQKDYLNGTNDLNNEDSALDAGLGDDASMDYDEDDATLTAENDDDVVATGMDESDADNLEGKESLGDTVV